MIPYDGAMVNASGWVRAAVVLAMLSFAGVAYSHSGGITGKSGKQGSTCNSCHGGGKAPKVTLSGPTSLDAGASAVYTFQLETDAAVTGMNAAVSANDGVMTGDDAGFTRAESGEVTHAKTVKPDAGVVIYSFSMTAPPFGGKYTLFAAGNACNNNGQSDGDDSSATTLMIDVNGPPRPPEPEAGTTPPVTTSQPPATTPDAGSDSGNPGPTGKYDVRDAPPAEDDSSCSIGWADRTSAPAGAMLGAFVGLAALLRKRRR